MKVPPCPHAKLGPHKKMKIKEGKNKNPFEAIVSDKVEEIALRAAEMPEFQKIIKGTPSRLEAIKKIREVLEIYFPEITEIPEPRAGEAQKPIGGLPSSEFLIAKSIVELLSEENKK